MALNDPQWGNRKNGGPPDLEEMLRKFNRKIAALLGGGGGSGGGRSGAGGPAGAGIGVVVAIALLVWIGSGFYQVDSSQRGVVLRFGKYTETTLSGLHWHLPFPVESVEVVNTAQVRTAEVGYRDNIRNKALQESLMLTDDENIVDVQFAVQYTVKNVTDYVFNNRMQYDANGMPDDTEMVRQIAETAIREVVGRSKINYVLYEGQGQVVSDTAKLMQDLLDRYKTGILISQVTMQNAQPPQEVQASFADAVKAKADEERQKNEGMAYANNVVPGAQGDAARLKQEAQGYKQSVIEHAEGDASRFKQILAEYNKAPKVTRERMYIEMMQQILSSTTKVMVDQKSANNLLYLPLDKLLQRDGSGAAGQPVAQPPAAKPAEPAAPQALGDQPTVDRDRRERP